MKKASSPIRHCHLRPLALAVLLAFPVLAAAADAQACVGTAFTGDRRAGIVVTQPPPYVLDIYDLSFPIAPLSGPAVQLSSQSGAALTACTGRPAAVVRLTPATGSGIVVASIGRPAVPPTRDAFFDLALPGTDKAQGGEVLVVNRANIVTTARGAHGINASSNTAGYPDSMIDALRNLNLARFRFDVTSVVAPGGSTGGVGVPVTAALVQTREVISPADPAIKRTEFVGYGIEAGSFKVGADGGVEFAISDDDFAKLGLATNDEVTLAVQVSLQGFRDGVALAGSDGLERGRVSARIKKDADGRAQVVATWADFDRFGQTSLVTPGAKAQPDLAAAIAGYITQAEGAGGLGKGAVVEHLEGKIETQGAAAHGVWVRSAGISGAPGREGGGFWSFGTRPPTAGQPGQAGGDASVRVDGEIHTRFKPADGAVADASIGVLAHSAGGNGGDGGAGGTYYYGRAGATGANAGSVIVTGSGKVTTEGRYSSAIVAISAGGDGGSGGGGDIVTGGGVGSTGGLGGEVRVSGRWTIETARADAHGIWAKSTGGNAGSGGKGGWLLGAPAGGAQATDGGKVTIESAGSVTTSGDDAYALFGQSVGGFGGSGGAGANLFYSRGGSGASAGSGGAVSVTNDVGGSLTTGGVGSHALLAQSVGGGGGAGGSGSGIVARGGSGAYGGAGGEVTATNKGLIVTGGVNARGIYAQSVGGGGGDGGDASGIGAFGGTGSGTSDGGKVKVVNQGSVETQESGANAIFAQSIGGGGGSGGSSKGWFSLGGSGGGGGNANTVTVEHSGALLKTVKEDASALFAQSVGGGGGKGGSSVAVGSFAAVAIGGAGAMGGTGEKVTVTNTAGEIATEGKRSHGIFAQSIGGGGGDGGFSVAASAGLGASLSVAVGGSGAKGGAAGEVFVDNASKISTAQAGSIGLFAESIGGGGGSGGFAIAGAASDGVGVSFALGGSGKGGGAGKKVTVINSGAILTGAGGKFTGTQEEIANGALRSYGIFAQSVGGGGGNGGFSIGVSGGGLGAFGLTLGGAAAGGGGADEVNVSNRGAIGTAGIEAHALFAQSIGGGGGNGGFSVNVAGGGTGAGTFTVGGTGGAGGSAGLVFVDNSGKLTTTRDKAIGLFAQSVGGGGGNGGFAISGAAGGVGAGTFNLGGSGEKGGDASTVTVKSHGDIITGGIKTGELKPGESKTLGAEAHGVFAQSIGGGGGNGGFSVTGAAAGTGAGSIGIGGSGDEGGAGQLVDVDQTGRIEVFGEKAIGVVAQSLGGGGGNGGFSIAANAAKTAAGSLTLGGTGLGGGAGGEVKLVSDGTLITHGTEGHGLFAQSVGGGGGNGGFSIAGAGAGTGSGSLSIGGTAGKGGSADAVTVRSAGSIDTAGEKAVGLYAQSVGGGGGNGGFAFAGALGSKLTLSVALGGDGGPGGAGRTVQVESASAIQTSGGAAHAIQAQSIGGGGGSGGMALTGTVNAASGSGFTASVTVGGKAGKGGIGGDVFVGKQKSLTGSLTTCGSGAHGVFAQSVGGGGGQGGAALGLNFSADAKLKEKDKTLSASFTFGGDGGDGNLGGAVTVNSASTIGTAGADAHGIFAQSVGGGGGSNGGAEAISLSTSELMPWKDSKATNLGLEITAGGDAGSGNKGGKVSVTNDGTITTLGFAARGIFAQSVGGGGGAVTSGVTGKAGEWIGKAQDVLDAIGLAKTIFDAFKEKDASGLIPNSLSITLGSNEGSGADADAVSVTNSGSIGTAGAQSHAIFAQSVGAGGGDAKAYAEGRGGGESVDTGIGLLGEFVVGGAGGAAGSGAAVTVTHTGARLLTRGTQAHGIYAQSVGGGGGSAGSVEGGFSGVDSIGLGLGFARKGGSAGNGGAVTVTSGGAIETTGERAIGIVAQSVGGGGGAASQRSGLAFFGSVGGFGSGGAVKVTHEGTILTQGARAHGIFAQSAGGKDGDSAATTDYKGQGGTVDVTLKGGGIAASGDLADGILAQSVGIGGKGGAITVTLERAVVQGGTGDAAGVRLLDGAANRILNQGGVIGTARGIEGLAIVGTTGDDTVHNSGRVIGSLDLGGGRNAFVNEAGGIIEAGNSLRLGTGHTLTNAGVLSAGGAGVLRSTALDGHLTQSAGGSLAIDIDLMNRRADRIDVAGNVALAGSLQLRAAQPAPAQDRVVIVTAGGTLDTAALTMDAARSAVATYTLATQGRELALDYRIDFADVAGLSANQRRLGAHVNAIQRAGSTEGFAPVADALFALPEVAALDNAYDHLGAESHAAMPASMLLSGLQFGDALLSCRSGADGTARFVSEGECTWASAASGTFRLRHDATGLGFKREGLSLSAGLQRQLAPEWHLGLAIGVELGALDSGGFATAHGEQAMVGAMLKWRRGTSTVSGALTAGTADYRASRNVPLPSGMATALSEPRLRYASAHFRLAHAFGNQTWYLRPLLDLGATHVEQRAFEERNAGAANLSVLGTRQTTWTLRAALETGGEWRRADGSLQRPYLRAGALRVASGMPGLQASLQNVPAGVAPFAAEATLDRTIGEVALGVDLLHNDGSVLRLGYTGQFSGRIDAHLATVKVSMPF